MKQRIVCNATGCSSPCLERLLSGSWRCSFPHRRFRSRAVCWIQSWIARQLDTLHFAYLHMWIYEVYNKNLHFDLISLIDIYDIVIGPIAGLEMIRVAWWCLGLGIGLVIMRLQIWLPVRMLLHTGNYCEQVVYTFCLSTSSVIHGARI